MDEFADADFHTGFLDELLASRRLAELHGAQDPDAEEAAVIAAVCLATLESGAVSGGVFAHADGSHWWQEGLRQQHGRFPR
jgi:hypothetical protein